MGNPLITIPLCQLQRSKLNIRKTDKHADVEQMAASIQSHGLLENLVVQRAQGAKNDAETYEVAAGGRRLAALKLLAKRNKIPRDYGVMCLVLQDGAARAAEASLAENIVRVPLHPADQFEAFARLQKQGLGAEDIAARFGIQPTIVLQRLKLAQVSPRLLAEYRKGEMALEQLMAFTVSDDHRAQEEIWFDHPVGYSSPQDIRRSLTKFLVDGRDRRARFVGYKAYEAAGGTIMRDLFQSEAEGYFADSSLLDRLAAKKLQGEAFAIKEEGWGWVEVRLETDFAYLARFLRLPTMEVELSAPDEKRLAALCERYDKLVTEIEEDDDASTSELDRVSEEIDQLQAKKETWPEEQRMKAGAVVSLDPHGRVHITRGLVKREDASEVREPSGEDADAITKNSTNGYSASLLADLAAHRTAALREVLANTPEKALCALLETLVPQVFFDSHSETALEINLKSVDLTKYSDSVGESKAAAVLLSRHKLWLERMPERDKLWNWLASLEQSDQLALLAHCTVMSVNGVCLRPEDRRGQCMIALAQAVSLDMAYWWRPTAANFFDRVSKEDILGAVSEGASPGDAARLRMLKKRQMSAAAEKLLGEGRWLPLPLRSE